MENSLYSQLWATINKTLIPSVIRWLNRSGNIAAHIPIYKEFFKKYRDGNIIPRNHPEEIAYLNIHYDGSLSLSEECFAQGQTFQLFNYEEFEKLDVYNVYLLPFAENLVAFLDEGLKKERAIKKILSKAKKMPAISQKRKVIIEKNKFFKLK